MNNAYRHRMLDYLLPTLCSIIKTDYVLLDTCLITNVGDLLIWQAFEDIKTEIPHKCLHAFGIETYKAPKIDKNVTLVFMGGGNFGDLWERHQIFRHRVMEDFPDNPIVQLPQSVWWESKEKMEEDVRSYAKHNADIHICLRDAASFDIIKKNYTNVHPYLLPDLALVFDVETYCRKHCIENRVGDGSLLIKRKDKEQVELDGYEFPKNMIEHDWLPMEEEQPVQKAYKSIILLLKKIPYTGKLRRYFMQVFFRKIIMPKYITMSIMDMMQYKYIYSTRLHGGVLAFLLGKETVFIDNSYRKISGVYEEWMSDCENVRMI